MKYIDADRLIAEIERRKQTHKNNIENGFPDDANKITEDNNILYLVKSLQQEPRFPQYDNIVDKVFGAGNLEGFEYHEAEMLVALAKEELIKSLQQEQPDYKEAIQLVFEEKLMPFKDGNQWCFLLGHNIQEGVCGFGDTILDAAIDFYKDYSTTRIHTGELKKTMEQPEVDLKKEISNYLKIYHLHIKDSGRVVFDNDDSPNFMFDITNIARHFYELGRARKEE